MCVFMCRGPLSVIYSFECFVCYVRNGGYIICYTLLYSILPINIDTTTNIGSSRLCFDNYPIMIFIYLILFLLMNYAIMG